MQMMKSYFPSWVFFACFGLVPFFKLNLSLVRLSRTVLVNLSITVWVNLKILLSFYEGKERVFS